MAKINVTNDKVSIDDLFARWREDHGYDRAVLISCCYPLEMVLAMSDEDAEAELQAIDYEV